MSMCKDGGTKFGAPEPMEVLGFVDSTQRPQVGQTGAEVVGILTYKEAAPVASSGETRDLGTRHDGDDDMGDAESAPIGIPVESAFSPQGGETGSVSGDAPGDAAGVPDGAPGEEPAGASNPSRRGRPEGATEFEYLKEVKELIRKIREQYPTLDVPQIANKAEIELGLIRIEKEQKTLLQIIMETRPDRTKRRAWLTGTIRALIKSENKKEGADGVAVPSPQGGDADMIEDGQSAPEPEAADVLISLQGGDADMVDGVQGAPEVPVAPLARGGDADMTDSGQVASPELADAQPPQPPPSEDADMVNGVENAEQNTTYDLVEFPSEYKGNVLDETSIQIKIMSEIGNAPKYAEREYFEAVRPIIFLDDWLKKRVYTLLEHIIKLDTKPAEKIRPLGDVVKTEESLEEFKRENPWYNHISEKKDANLRYADAYTLWFNPLLESIKKHTGQPDWIYQAFKMWIDSNIELADEIGVSEVAHFNIQLEKFVSDSKEMEPKLQHLTSDILVLFTQLKSFQYQQGRKKYSEEIVSMWFPFKADPTGEYDENKRVRDVQLPRLEKIEDSTHDSLVTLIKKLTNEDLELVEDDYGLKFKKEGVERTKDMFLGMIDALTSTSFYKTPLIEIKTPVGKVKIRHLMQQIANKIELIMSGWADQAARLTRRIVTRVDEQFLEQNPVDQFARIEAAYNENYCYVNSKRTLPDTKQQGGSVVQKQSAINAKTAYSKNRRSVLYNWATGTGKTSAIWCEIFAAIANNVEHAYVSLIRWGTAQDIFSNIYGAKNGNHIEDIAKVVFGEELSIEVDDLVTVYYKNDKKDSQSGLEMGVWTDDEKMVLSFGVKVNEKTITVYLSRLIDWATLAVPAVVVSNKTNKDKDIRKHSWENQPLEEVITPIVDNKPRIFIVDEAHEIRKNDAVTHIKKRRVAGTAVGNTPYFEYLHEDNTWKKEAPESWGKQSNCLLKLIRGDITPKSWINLDDENNVLRCAYLTATPIAQKWEDFIDFLSSMYVVTHDNGDVNTLSGEYGDENTQGLRTSISHQIIGDVQKPVEEAMTQTQNVTMTTKINALKKGRSIIMEMLNRFEIDVSLDLFSTLDMPYTNYSMTNTGIGYNGLTLTQNTPIIVKVDTIISRFHALLNAGSVLNGKDLWTPEWWNSRQDWIDIIDEDHGNASAAAAAAAAAAVAAAAENSVQSGLNIDDEDEPIDNPFGDESAIDDPQAMVVGAKRSAETPSESSPSQPNKKSKINTDSNSFKEDMKKRFTCAIYCFKSEIGPLIPYPVVYELEYDNKGGPQKGTKRSFHTDLFRVEYEMFTKPEVVQNTIIPQRESRHQEILTTLFFPGELGTEMSLLRCIYAFALHKEPWTTPTNMVNYRSLWMRVVQKVDGGWRFNEDVIQCVSPKLDMIARAVCKNELSPSMVFFIINGFGGSNHLAMLLDRQEKPIKLIKATKNETSRITSLPPDELYQERCVIMNGDATPTNRDAITNEDTGLFNDDRNAHGRIIRCIIFVAGSAASITLRNVLVCHYPIDDYYILRYVQSLGRIARRSAFNQTQPTKLKLFGFTATKENPEGHDLVVEDNCASPEEADSVNEIFKYKNEDEPIPAVKTEKQRTPGHYNEIRRVPVCSYITYRIELSECNVSTSIKRSIDDRIGEISLQASSIYTIVQLALATLSQNCADNSKHFAQVTGNDDFVKVCDAVQTTNLEDLKRDIEIRAVDFSTKKMEKLMKFPDSVPSQIQKWVYTTDYFTKWRTGQSVVTKAREELKQPPWLVVLDPTKWTGKEMNIILKIIVKKGQLVEKSGKFKQTTEPRANVTRESPEKIEEREFITQWIVNNIGFYSAGGRTALQTAKKIREEQTALNQKPLGAYWTAPLVAEILRANDNLEEADRERKLFKQKITL